MFKRLALSLLTAALAGPGCAANDAPAIRIVSQGQANLAALKTNIEVAVQACQAARKLPQTRAALPPDAFLAALPVLEEEQLFDGPLSAHYATYSSVMPNPAAGCKLQLFKSRTASVGKSCESRSWGGLGNAEAVLNFESPQAPDWQIDSESRETTGRKCNVRVAKPLSAAGLPTESSGAGPQCVWHSAVMNRLLEAAGAKPVKASSRDETDFCVNARLPEYPYTDHAGKAQLLTLKTRASDLTAGGTHLAGIVGELQALNTQLKTYEEGTAIPSARFTRAAIESFVKQPVWEGLGVKQ